MGEIMTKVLIYSTDDTPDRPSCVYLVTYQGKMHPTYYIGSTFLDKFHNGYLGSTSSRKWAEIVNQEQINHPELYSSELLYQTNNRKEAFLVEYIFQKEQGVITSDKYWNMAMTIPGQGFIADTSGYSLPVATRNKISNTLSNKTDEQKALSKQKRQQTIKNRSTEEQKKVSQHHSEGQKKYNNDPKNAEAISAKQSKIASAFWSGVTETQVNEIVKKRQTTRDTWSNEEKARIKKLQSIANSKPKEQATCTVCGVTQSQSNITKRHNDKCQQK